MLALVLSLLCSNIAIRTKWCPCKTDLNRVILISPSQVREDVTRYRYGDEQHLDEALDRVFRFGKVKQMGVTFCASQGCNTRVHIGQE